MKGLHFTSLLSVDYREELDACCFSIPDSDASSRASCARSSVVGILK